MFKDKTLRIKVGDVEGTIVFSKSVKREEDIKDIFRLRYKIYTKYNYIDRSQFKKNEEYDDYDTRGESIYFTAKTGGRYIGFVRLIQSEVLPIEKFFDFTAPQEIKQSDRAGVAELGRLVIDKYSDDFFLPRNMILLFLTSCIAEYCEENDIQYAYSFIKKKLFDKLTKIGFPVNRIEPYQLAYPHTGPMAPYFFNEEDPVYPAYFSLSEVKKFIKTIIKNKMLFKQESETEFVLQNNLYTRFLKAAKVI